MLMKKEPDSQDNTRPDNLNNFKFHLCICEKPINFVFLQMFCFYERNDIMDIGVFWRLGFDSVRISQIQTVSQKQGNGDAPWDVYRQPILCI